MKKYDVKVYDAQKDCIGIDGFKGGKEGMAMLRGLLYKLSSQTRGKLFLLLGKRFP